MKELSIEEKAKAYDRVSKEVKDFFEGRQKMYSDINKTLEYLFPELKESEDENIRKGLIQYFSTFSLDTFAGLAPKKIIAWLEKQKPIELDKDAEIRFRSILNLIDNGCPIEKSYIDFIKSVYVMLMKSQQQKTSENDYLKKQGEQKPAWSEEDDKKRKGLIKGLEDRMGFGWASDPFSREEYIDWLKSLKDRVQLQPKKEWSEEDENMFKSILNDIETMRNNATVEQYIDVCNNKIDWFKSLKDKVRLSIDEKSIPLKEFVLNVWMLGNEWKDITKGIFDTEHGTQLEYVLKHWKEGEYYLRAKQDEQKPVEESWPNLSNCLHDCKNCTGRCIYRKEEYQNQKPTDKVEPKFHEGDWIVQGCNILKIRYVGNEYYCFETVGGYIDDMLISEIDSLYRLWTIQDAKDGDVLYMDNGLSTCTFIYETINNRIIQKYASYNKFGFEGRHYLILNDGYVCPATKEQCDLLFQKMKEAGYEWDAEKKELKKIEQNPADKVEPKFKVGDWVVHDMSDGRKVIEQIINMTNKSYILDNKDFNTFYFNDLENDYRLWTIQDAKDGDVLVFDDIIMIFKNIKTVCTANTYILYCDKIVIDDWCDFGNNAQPATKEQRDLLFQKMKEAGYEWDAYKKELKKIEQKPADKVEPKFKVGDWVVYKCDICKIVKREEGCNKLVTNFGIAKEFVNERNLSTARLWTIQDAKDGDVLAFKNNIGGIIICKSPTDYDTESYCRLASDNLINKEESGWDSTLLVPATKEQRDRLFQEMKEAGYEWDAKEKGLKKIEQKPTNNVIEEEKPLLEKFKQAVYDCAWGKVTCKKEGETKEEYAERWAEQFLLIVRDWADDYIDFTIQQKLRNSYEKGKTDVIEKLHGQQPAWSEEDENEYNHILKILNLVVEEQETKGYNNLIGSVHWLKSLKDRVQPQQKQEWSEGEELRNKLLEALEYNAQFGYAIQKIGLKLEDVSAWLKSLKDLNESLKDKMKGEIKI